MRVPGGGASCLVVGRPGSGALPPPTARPLGGLPGPTTHWLWVRRAAGVKTIAGGSALCLSGGLCGVSPGGGRKIFLIPADMFFVGGKPPLIPLIGGGGTKKSGSYKKKFFFPCHTYHT